MKKSAKKKPAAKNTDAERGIFTFRIGPQTYRVDPVAAIFTLKDHPDFDWGKDPIAADNGDKAAMNRTMQAVADAFGLLGLDKGGATIAERMQLLLEFSAWCDAQKKSIEPSPMPSPMSELPSADLAPPSKPEFASTPNGSPREESPMPVSLTDTP
jgi:hypothetical protein